MGGSCHLGFLFPWGSSCEELNEPAIWLHGGAPLLAHFFSCYLSGSSRFLRCPWVPVLWGSEKEGWGETGFPSLVLFCVWNINQSVTNLVVWRVSCTFSLRSQVNSVLLSPLHEHQSVPRHEAKCLALASLTLWADVLSPAFMYIFLGASHYFSYFLSFSLVSSRLKTFLMLKIIILFWNCK